MQTRLVAKRTGRGLILLAALVQAHYGIATSMPMSLPTVGGTYEPTERILPIASTPILAPLPTPTPTPTPSVAPGLTRSLNISTRLFVGSAGASDVGIGGFIITGTTPREVLIRALGPSLPVGNGVVLPDPELELHGPAGFTTVTNNNWRETQEQQIIATGIPPIDDLESAILVTLDPGAYTAIVQGKGNVGVGLVEIYDLTQGGDSKLANLSTRGNVYRERDFLMIAGFILGGGTDNDLVIVRGLAPFDGGLIDPILELRNSQGALVCANDNWMDNPSQKAIIIAANLQPSNNLESAIAESLAPGAYTSVLSGVGIVTIWTGLIEVYDRPVVDYGSGAAHALFPLEGDF